MSGHLGVRAVVAAHGNEVLGVPGARFRQHLPLRRAADEDHRSLVLARLDQIVGFLLLDHQDGVPALAERFGEQEPIPSCDCL